MPIDKVPAKRATKHPRVRVGDTVAFKIGGKRMNARVVQTLRRAGSSRQLLRLELASTGKGQAPRTFSIPADLLVNS